MFFKDIEDYQKYVPVTAAFQFPQIEIYLNDVDRTVLKKYLGSTFLAALQTVFDDAETFAAITSPHKDLIEQLRVCSANLALAKWLPMGQVNISQSGVRINVNENSKTAFQWQVEGIERSCKELGYNALEEALSYLEENIDESDFSTYKSSDQFKDNNYLFVSSGTEFSKYFGLMLDSRINFHKLRSTIRKVEDFEIKAVLLPTYFDDLKTTLQAGDTLGSNAQIIVDMIKPALVNLTIAKAIGDMAVTLNDDGLLTFDNASANESVGLKQANGASLSRIYNTAEKDGKNYLKLLKNYLETNKADYPLYSGDSLYVAPADALDLNDGTRPFFTGI